MDDHVLDYEGALALCELTNRLMVAFDAPTMAAEIADIAHGVVGAAYAQLGLLSSSGDSLVLYHGADLDQRAQDEWPVVPLDVNTPVGEVMKTGQPIAIDSAAALVDEFPIIQAATDASGYESLVVVPVLDPLQPRRCAATLSAAWVARDQATERAVEILSDLADRCALALANAGLTERPGRNGDERGRVLALQRSLLPSIRVESRGVEITSRYWAAADGLEVGGDWYAAVPLSEGRLAVAVGDVAGHDFEAVLTMGQIRKDFEALAAHHRRPSELVAEIDRFASQRGSLMTTAAFVYLDLREGHVLSVVAGHPPPILLRGGEVLLLEHSLGPPLGTPFEDRTWGAAASTAIRSGDTLVLSTDGLIERRGESIDRGIQRLVSTAASAATFDLEELCDRAAATMLADETLRDDAAMLAVRLS